ncbi:carboxylating nicotinate-nucleotide diphosphorylase [Aliikangiella coralliicola]|uniref:nicotinate-nucleotide diphosphorylase (carboxylating) n=2 Tax=Aliikangiella coralliicola TaxID=2592383 RepID=A0A545U0N0_9GAMM|nr:carboxylating nicotinate-nucleotide diphosphorylase [Aliikangiella coralliicola]
MCQFALAEDLADCSINADSARDITAELIPKDKIASATLITREAGVLCGTAWVDKIFELLGGNVTIKWNFQDGDKLSPEDVICTLEGNARELLTGERSAMNFVQSLSATATLTSLYAEPLVGTNCRLLDTRKTLPGMRFGQKYAVKCGGGTNHRIGLSDAFLIKENHIMACGGIPQALNQAILNHPDKLLEIEVESLDELQQALDGKAQVIMLDNFSLEQMREAKKQRDQHSSKVLLEASGNVSLEAIKSIADTGVDYISVGALTKNVQALDLSMRISIDLK